MARHTEHQHFAAATFSDITLPASCAANSQIAVGAGIQAEKLEHQHSISGSQPNTTATSEERVIHTVYGNAGNVLAFEVGSIVACLTDADITIDLHKNGASILTGVITLESTNTAYIVEAGSIDTAVLEDGDVLEVVIVATVNGGTLGTGLFWNLRLNEDAQ